LAHQVNLQASVKPSFTQVVEQAQWLIKLLFVTAGACTAYGTIVTASKNTIFVDVNWLVHVVIYI
jgi:hypothetical protein